MHVGSSLIISKHRRIPIETETDAVLQVRIGETGASREVNGSTIPSSWRDAAENIRRTRGLSVILGDVDSGKSTLCTYLANISVDQKIRIGVIDGDVGQADIGPPTTTSSSTVSKHIFTLQDLRPEKSYFIGDTSPSSVPDKLIHSIVRLRDELSTRSETTIVNTDSWVKEDEAVQHKLQLINSLQPDLVLSLSLDHELERILELQHHPTLRLEASRFARTRTREERKKAREEGYRRFLRNATQLDLRLNAVKLRSFNGPRQQRIDQASTHTGTLAGLLDEKGMLLSIGRVVRIGNGNVRITATAEQMPRTIELGAVILSSKFDEIGYES